MSVLTDYWNVLSDPGHTLAEITYDIIVWVVLTKIWQSRIKVWIRREHREIDAEHGHLHVDEAEVIWLDDHRDLSGFDPYGDDDLG